MGATPASPLRRVILLDTNVLSALMSGDSDSIVARWMDRFSPAEFWTTSLTVFEIRFGLARMPAGRRREGLTALFQQMLDEDFAGRVAGLDRAAADAAGRLAATRDAAGRQTGIQDTMIAGIAITRGAAIATRNIRDFADLDVLVINPWAEG